MNPIQIVSAIIVMMSCGQNSNTKSNSIHSDTLVETPMSNVIEGKDTLLNFEESQVGILPEAWTAATGKWTIAIDDNIKVLKQTAENSGSYYNICVNSQLAYENLQLSVKLKAVSGDEDRGGGVVWRYADKNNYYIVRANPLERNVVLYKVQNGKRSDLPLKGKGRTYGLKAPMESGKWHTLQVNVAGNNFTVSLDEKQLFQVIDDTFTKAGLVGVWTKADAVTVFDDLTIFNYQINKRHR